MKITENISVIPVFILGIPDGRLAFKFNQGSVVVDVVVDIDKHSLDHAFDF